MRVISAEHTTLILNGHQFEGFANSPQAIQLPEITLGSVERGPEGLMYFSTSGDKGGPLVVMLMATSDSTKYMMRQISQLLSGGIIKWSGTIENPTLQYSTRFEEGVLTTVPTGISGGKSSVEPLQFSWEFESVVPNFDAADFEPNPVQNLRGVLR